MASCFIQWIIVHYYHYFDIQIISILANGGLFKLLPSISFSEHFLSGIIRFTMLTLYFAYPSLESRHFFPRGFIVPCSWKLYLETKVCVLSMSITIGISLLRPLSRYKKGIYVRISIYIYNLYLFTIHLSIYIHIYWKVSSH